MEVIIANFAFFSHTSERLDIQHSTHTTGSGSTYVYGYCDATYQEGWNQEQTVQFVKNSTLALYFSSRSYTDKQPLH